MFVVTTSSLLTFTLGAAGVSLRGATDEVRPQGLTLSSPSVHPTRRTNLKHIFSPVNESFGAIYSPATEVYKRIGQGTLITIKRNDGGKER